MTPKGSKTYGFGISGLTELTSAKGPPKSSLNVRFMTLQFVKQMIELQFLQRFITLKTRLNISPSFYKVVDEL